MKNLLVFASTVLVGAAAFAGVQPRVYQYSACLKTTVAKNANVKVGGVTDSICYRAAGTLNLKGVIILGCNCNSFDGDANDTTNLVEIVDNGDDTSTTNTTAFNNVRTGFLEAIKTNGWEWADTMAAGYPIVLLATSADSYKKVVFAGGLNEDNMEYYANFDTWGAARFGNPLSAKATSAELGFWLGFQTAGGTRTCGREFSLGHAGFGSAGVIEGAAIDITSISGSIIGEVSAPICSAADNNCPRCQADGVCETAIAFTPCFDDSVIGEGAAGDWDVAYGTFTLTYNKTLANSVKLISAANYQATVNAIVPKAFGSQAVAPTLPVLVP